MIRGTRVTVQVILELLAEGETVDDLAHISTHHAAITSAFAEADFIELGNNALALHPRRS